MREFAVAACTGCSGVLYGLDRNAMAELPRDHWAASLWSLRACACRHDRMALWSGKRGPVPGDELFDDGDAALFIRAEPTELEIGSGRR